MYSRAIWSFLFQAVGCLMSVIIDSSFNPQNHRDWKALGFSPDTANKAELAKKFFLVCFNKANIAERFRWVLTAGCFPEIRLSFNFYIVWKGESWLSMMTLLPQFLNSFYAELQRVKVSQKKKDKKVLVCSVILMSEREK